MNCEHFSQIISSVFISSYFIQTCLNWTYSIPQNFLKPHPSITDERFLNIGISGVANSFCKNSVIITDHQITNDLSKNIVDKFAMADLIHFSNDSLDQFQQIYPSSLKKYMFCCSFSTDHKELQSMIYPQTIT